jgi:hypothetical protein
LAAALAAKVAPKQGSSSLGPVILITVVVLVIVVIVVILVLRHRRAQVSRGVLHHGLVDADAAAQSAMITGEFVTINNPFHDELSDDGAFQHDETNIVTFRFFSN